MNPSQTPNAHNSSARKQAEHAMERAAWAEALAAWKAFWVEDAETAGEDPNAMHDRAVCHFHCGDKGVALDWLNRAADLQPEYSYRYSSRGWMKQALGDTHGAIADYKHALELDPDDAVTWNNLGLLEEQLGYQEQAKERYRVSDELLGILKERGIDPESSTPAFEERPAQAEPTKEDGRTFWGEIKRAIFTSEGRKEVWTFVANGFTLRG
jgi:tetratricopeptide (TPR) repeat protein